MPSREVWKRRAEEAEVENARLKAENTALCQYRQAWEYLEGKTFRFVLSAKGGTGYLFTRPGPNPDGHGKTPYEALKMAMQSTYSV